MHCASCGYELIGLPPGACPECSHPFDPDDPATWVERPIPPWRKVLVSRWSGYVAITLVGFCAMWFTILPRPYVAFNGTINPRLWIWFDEPFGMERQRAMPEQLDLSWWNGTLTGARLRRPDPSTSSPDLKVAWDIRRRADHWDLNVLQRDVPLRWVLVAYNSMRSDSELFGLQLEDPNDSPTARSQGFGSLNTEPFRVAGRQEDVLSAILVAYDLSVRSLLITPEDTDLWIFNKDQGRLERISVQEADERGIPYTVVDSLNVGRHRFRQ
jgi:hypothetical protein